MAYSSKTTSLAKVFQSENYKRGEVSKVCTDCKGKPKVITEFATRKMRGKIYLKSKCRRCDTAYVLEYRKSDKDKESQRVTAERYEFAKALMAEVADIPRLLNLGELGPRLINVNASPEGAD